MSESKIQVQELSGDWRCTYEHKESISQLANPTISNSDTTTESNCSSNCESYSDYSGGGSDSPYFQESTLTQRDDAGEFGWFNAIPDIEEDESLNNEVRNAWNNRVDNVINNYESNFFANYCRSPSFLSTVSSSCEMKERNEEEVRILFSWSNPNASISMKLAYSSPELSNCFDVGINISCCVNGFRISQFPNGEIKAEFNFVFCYGSRSYNSWKLYSDFKHLFETISAIKSNEIYADPYNVLPVFHLSLAAWQFVEAKKKWYKCLSVKYLIEKSIYLGRFMEAVLLESPNPGLILYFVQKKHASS